MRFINFNQHRKLSGDWNLTYKAWTKQYLASLNAKITSLQDYIVYNNPQYVIFNSPDEKNQINIVDRGLQYDDDENQVSLFFPAKLNWHQGFYNQSRYGDGILMYKEEDYYRSYQQFELTMPVHHKFDSQGVWYATDTKLSNYVAYIYTDVKEHSITVPIERQVFAKQEAWISLMPNCYDFSVYFNHYGDKSPVDNVQYDYNNNVLKITWDIVAIPTAWPIYISIYCKQEVELEWYESNITSNLFNLDSRDKIEYKGSNPCVLIHRTQQDSLGSFSVLRYADNQLKCSVKFPTDTTYVSKENSTYVIEERLAGWHDDILTTTSEIYKYKDLPSGYVCILNKQPIGNNNELNPIKQSLNSYLVAPIGNGAYYAMNFFDNNLIAQYTPNDLGNFINQVRINLGQNLRYTTHSDVYIKGISSIDKKGGVFALPNISINDKNEITDIITDHQGNLWTGGDELVAQTVHHVTKEEIFMDVNYDIYTSQLKRNVIHNFNVSTKEDIVDIKQSNKETISMIQLQLF